MQINDLSLYFGNKNVLKNVNIQISQGEFVFFIGLSGSGKTSIIRSIIGDFKPKTGNIILDDGNDLYKFIDSRNLAKYRRSIGVIFQDYKLMESKSVYENVAFALEVCSYNNTFIQGRVPEVLEQVGLISKKDSFVSELSGGEKQRVSIARALAHNPNIIIGDEPTGNLDPKTSLEIMDIFDDLNKEGKTIIIATHDKNIVNSMKKRVITFKDKTLFSDKKKGDYNLDLI